MSKFDKTGANLIFIISLPRSGSTMLQKMIGSHSAIYAPAEPWIMLHPLYALKNEGIVTNYEAPLAKQALDEYLKQLINGQDTYIDALRSMASILYGSALEQQDKIYFLDKTPRYYYIIPELVRVFPNAKYIILFRNPLAVLSSVLKTWFNNQTDLLLKSFNRNDMFAGPSLLTEGLNVIGSNAIVVHYEDIVNNPSDSLSRIFDDLCLTFNPEFVYYNDKNTNKGSFGDQSLIHTYNEPVTASIERWKDNLSSHRIIEFAISYLNSVGSTTINSLGYSFDELINELTKLK